MSKSLITIRCSLIMLQLLSLTIASVILIVYYNPWIERMIDEAEKSGNTLGQSLSDQIRRIEGEEIVIFLMSAATILVSLLGVIGTIRGHEHNHCLLNFYMSTLIIFLFVIFVALCGTFWELMSKLHHSSSLPVASVVPTLGSNRVVTSPGQFDSTYLIDDFDLRSVNNLTDSLRPTLTSGASSSSSSPADEFPPILPGDLDQGTGSKPPSPPPIVTWWYIAKSFLFISLSAAVYATSLKLTRRILESLDDRYLSANDDDADDLNSEASSIGIHYHSAPNHQRPFPYLYSGALAGIYNNGAMISGSKTLASSDDSVARIDGGGTGGGGGGGVGVRAKNVGFAPPFRNL